MTTLQYWTNQFKKYGEPYWKWVSPKYTLEEFLNTTMYERRKLINYLKKPSLLENINESNSIDINNIIGNTHLLEQIID